MNEGYSSQIRATIRWAGPAAVPTGRSGSSCHSTPNQTCRLTRGYQEEYRDGQDFISETYPNHKASGDNIIPEAAVTSPDPRNHFPILLEV